MCSESQLDSGLLYSISLGESGMEDVASGYWTRLAKPVSGQSAIAVRLRRPPHGHSQKIY